MELKKIVVLILIMILALTGCSMELNQNSASVETAVEGSQPDMQIPVTWGTLKLTGKLIYIFFETTDFSSTPSVRSLDLASGEIKTIFQVPSGGWIYYFSPSPDGKNLVLSYLPPAGGSTSASQALYLLPVDGSSDPTLWLEPVTSSDQYIQVEWSPDNNFIYYVHVNQKLPYEMGQLSPVYTLYRKAYPSGVPELIANDAFWPRLAEDASRIVYVSSDPFLPRNLLYIANPDGSNAREIILSGSSVPEIMDAPFILPDGHSVIFSASVAGDAYHPNWIDWLTGVKVVKAHSVPSDWWSVPVNGGTPLRLTKLQTVNLFVRLSPDQLHLASLSGNGIFVMLLDGSNPTQILSTTSVFGSLAWIP